MTEKKSFIILTTDLTFYLSGLHQQIAVAIAVAVAIAAESDRTNRIVMEKIKKEAIILNFLKFNGILLATLKSRTEPALLGILRPQIIPYHCKLVLSLSSHFIFNLTFVGKARSLPL